MNSNSSGEGTNDVTPLGTAEASSNAWLGIEGRIEDGTNGSRPNSSHAKYGGELDKGDLFYGKSVASDNKEQNSGGGHKKSNEAEIVGAGEWVGGTVGSREDMPKYGGETNVGKLVGLGAGSTKEVSPTDQLQRDLPAYPGLNVIDGTSDGKKNAARAMKGIGKPGSSGQRM